MCTYPGQMYPPAHQTYCYRTQLHQVSITYCRMQTYPGQTYTLLIEPHATEPYDTRSVWSIEEYMHTRAIGNLTYSDMGWSVFCSCLQKTSIMQDPESRQPPRNTYHRWTTGKWYKSPMLPYINMRTISNPDQFTHILPLAISCIMTPRYYFQGTGRCIPYTNIWWSRSILC